MTEIASPREAVTRETAVAVFSRVVERLNRGEAPPSVRLTVSKAEFPKLLFLDMKIWIELAKVHYERSQDPHASAALAAIRGAVEAGRLVLPISGSNLEEATKHPSEERRKRLATFMVALSGNFSCLNQRVVQDYEIDRAVEKHMVGSETLPPIRPHLIHWGLEAAGIGRPARGLEPGTLQAQLAREPELSVAQLVFGLDSDFHAQMLAREKDLVRTVDAARAVDAHMPVAERMVAALSYSLRNPSSYLDRILVNLAARGIPAQAYADLIADKHRLMRFAEDLHGLYIWVRLWFERDRNPQDRTAVNDSRDGGFLGQAIAYGNIVVTEKRWASFANTTRVAESYGTKVLGRVDDLPDLLRQEDCL